MNNTIVAQITRTPAFVVAATDAGLSPEMMGVLDAEEGRAFAPEMAFIRKGDMQMYAVGFASVAGDSIETLQFTDSIMGGRNK